MYHPFPYGPPAFPLLPQPHGWMGLAFQKIETAKTTPIAPAFKSYTCHLHLPQKKMASESHAGTSSFSQFFTRLLHGQVASQSPKKTSWV